MRCHHCKYEWDYKGKALYYATCPNCHYKTLLISKKLKVSLGKCQECNNHFSYLEIHHRDKDKTNNKPSNLMQLCRMCHKSKHKILNKRWRKG